MSQGRVAATAIASDIEPKTVQREETGVPTLPARKPERLSEWQQMFNRIYSSRNESMLRETIWLHLMDEAGEVAKDFRQEDYASLAKDLPDVFAWLCAFASKQAMDLESVVWDKYPRVCPFCGVSRNCICIAENKTNTIPEGSLNNYRKNRSQPDTLDGWLEMFGTIYGHANTVQSRSAIGFHLMEEIGEVANEILTEGTGCDDEIADVFAWLVAVYMKAQPDGPDDVLSASLWKWFPGVCKVCKHPVCDCPSTNG